MTPLGCFKAYDVRGRVPETLNPRVAHAIGVAFAEVLGARHVVVGRDCRLSGPALSQALMAGLHSAGAQVTDMGLCGTEEVYHAAFAHGFDGGIMVTGSHNPADENGMKFVRGGAVPVSGDSGLNDIRDHVACQLAYAPAVEGAEPCTPGAPLSAQDAAAAAPAVFPLRSFRDGYIRCLLRIAGTDNLRPLKIHADAGNGCAGLVLRELAGHLPYIFTFSNMEPDGAFPNGVPNPLLPERRAATARAVRESGADMGIAWDGDFDRCFLYDAQGDFIEGYYIVGLLARSILEHCPGAKIIHDPRLVWNTQDMVRQAGGTAIMSKTGHAFIKERMRSEDAVYGGEMSAHHYFRDFAYCDSGMLPWLLVAGLMVRTGATLHDLVAERVRAFPCSGEINRTVADARRVMAHIRHLYAEQALQVDGTDGLSMEFAQWRFNLRSSNTEPLLRLNVEARGNAPLVEEKTAELLRHMR